MFLEPLHRFHGLSIRLGTYEFDTRLQAFLYSDLIVAAACDVQVPVIAPLFSFDLT
jgi:hypothetical protein